MSKSHSPASAAKPVPCGALLLLLVCSGCRRAPDTAEPDPVVVDLPEVTLGSACGPDAEPGPERFVAFDGPPPKNIIMISIDTLRRDRVGRYSGHPHMPFLDARLAESVSLDNMLACANWTLPAVYCVINGHQMIEAGLEPLDPARIEDPTYLSGELPTLASHLQDAGWSTTLVTTAKLLSDQLPTGNGFQDVVFNNAMNAGAVTAATQEALNTLRGRAGDAPWFLHVHFRDPHAAYNPPGRYQGDLEGVDLTPYDPRTRDGVITIGAEMSSLGAAERREVLDNLEQLYAGELKYLDDEMALMWSAWEDSGILSDALVVFWSDHGEQFFEHGGFQHGATLHQEEALAIGAFWAEGLPAAAVVAPTFQTDIPATLLELYGIDMPTSGFPVGAVGADRVRVSVARDKSLRPLFSVDRQGHRLLYRWDGARAYYQTPTDPAETVDRYDAADQNVVCLWEHLTPMLGLVDQTTLGPPVFPGP